MQYAQVANQLITGTSYFKTDQIVASGKTNSNSQKVSQRNKKMLRKPNIRLDITSYIYVSA